MGNKDSLINCGECWVVLRCVRSTMFQVPLPHTRQNIVCFFHPSGCVLLFTEVSWLCRACVSLFSWGVLVVPWLCLTFLLGCLGCVLVVSHFSLGCLGCASVVSHLSLGCLGFVLVVSGLCLGCVWVESGLCLGCLCLGRVWAVSGLNLGCVWVVSGSRLGRVWVVSGLNLGSCLGCVWVV